MTAIQHTALKGNKKSALPTVYQRAHLHRSQNAPIPARRGMAGEWLESSPALVKPRISAKHILSQLRSHGAGQPDESFRAIVPTTGRSCGMKTSPLQKCLQSMRSSV